jgi:hypothetical protein
VCPRSHDQSLERSHRTTIRRTTCLPAVMPTARP